jgi:hypothetical protein
MYLSALFQVIQVERNDRQVAIWIMVILCNNKNAYSEVNFRNIQCKEDMFEQSVTFCSDTICASSIDDMLIFEVLFVQKLLHICVHDIFPGPKVNLH